MAQNPSTPPAGRGDPPFLTLAGAARGGAAPPSRYIVMWIATSYLPTDVRFPGVSPLGIELRTSSPLR